ncbi:H-NS family nucleoid-associated regulatory protein [Noviherbaspirillum sp. 1P10PC]|uniref:H-NS family nucleoid-associated regulatory protein n=1 Tax=Noviherbaspirillum sp. 1P10PC TaxID=3132292 RepID=UPI0039A2853B
MSNLNTARSLIQADLDHARQVLDLWTHQVSELERALEQIDAVGTSRDALRVEYRGSNSQGLALEKPAAQTEGKKRGRKPKTAEVTAAAKPAKAGVDIRAKRSRKLAERSTARAGQVTDAKAAKPAKTKAVKSKPIPEAKFKDPNSDKTWSGRGRRPFWMTGDAEQYAIGSEKQNPASKAEMDESKEPTTTTE